MKLLLPVERLFPDGYRLEIPEGTCSPFRPLQSQFDGSACFVEFSMGRIKNSDTEITVWHGQIYDPAWFECLKPVFHDGEWGAEINS